MAQVTMTNPPPQKNKILPLQDPYNPDQPVPVIQPGTTQAPAVQPQQVQPVSAPRTPTSQLAAGTLQQAGSQAQTGFQSPTATQTSQLTQNLLQDPNRGYDPSQAVQSGLTKYDRNAADAIETARRGMVGASGSSVAQSGLMDLALRTAEGRGELEGTLEQSASETAQRNMLNAITAGQATTGMEQGIQQGNLQNLLSTLSAAEPQLQREETAIDRGLSIAQTNQNAALQTMLTELKGKIDTGLMVRSQDFEGTQNELDRDIDRFVSEGNWQSALETMKLKGEIDIQAQDARQNWATGERVATQVWTSGERLSDQDFTSAENYLDRLSKEAVAEGDNETVKWVQNKKGDLALKMQTNDMDHEEKLVYLDNQLKNATADNDVGRQERILKFQSGLNLIEMEKESGYDVAIENLRSETQKHIADGNNTAARANLLTELEYRVNKDIEDRKIDYAAIALEEKGVDMQMFQQQLNNIDDMIENFGIDPAMKTDFVKATLEGQGVDTSQFTQIDVNAEAQKALDAEYELIQDQFMLSHPELIEEDTTAVPEWIDNGDGSQTAVYPKKMNSEGLKAFTDYYNFTMYGELSEEMKEERRSAGFLTEDDIPLAQEGEKFTVTSNYQSEEAAVPPGEYTVKVVTDKSGSKFFGNMREIKKYLFVDKNGNEYHVRTDTGGRQGALLSSLWDEQ